MEKCWFVLRHPDNPPPKMPTNPREQARGPICLGHIITSIASPDFPLNASSGPLRYPPNMPIHPSSATSFTWSKTNTSSNTLSTSVTAPIAAAAGVTVQSSAQIAFQNSVGNHVEFERLDTFITRPTKAYISDSLKDVEVDEWVKKQSVLGVSKWDLWMISGLKIARGTSKVKVDSSKSKSGSFSAGAGVAGVAEGSAGFGGERGMTTEGGYEMSMDFVWAVRLMRISKGVWGKDLKLGVEVRGATFGIDGEKESVESVVEGFQDSGLVLSKEEAKVVIQEDESFVLQV